jgi:hypothetical protein
MLVAAKGFIELLLLDTVYSTALLVVLETTVFVRYYFTALDSAWCSQRAELSRGGSDTGRKGLLPSPIILLLSILAIEYGSQQNTHAQQTAERARAAAEGADQKKIKITN